MVSKSCRLVVLSILFSQILFSCQMDGDYVRAEIINQDSTSSTFNYDIGYIIYDESGEELRSGIADPYAIKYLRTRIESDSEKYITFYIRSYTQGIHETPREELPIYLYMENRLIDIDRIINEETVNLYTTSPVTVEKIDATTLEIDPKNRADFYLVYFTEVGSDVVSFSFIGSKNNTIIDLESINNSVAHPIEDYIENKAGFQLLSRNQSFDPKITYHVQVMAFIENSLGELIQYTNFPLQPGLF